MIWGHIIGHLWYKELCAPITLWGGARNNKIIALQWIFTGQSQWTEECTGQIHPFLPLPWKCLCCSVRHVGASAWERQPVISKFNLWESCLDEADMNMAWTYMINEYIFTPAPTLCLLQQASLSYLYSWYIKQSICFPTPSQIVGQ